MIGSCALLLTIVWQIENWRGKRIWEATRASFVSDESELDWRTYWPERVPDETNAALHPVFAPIFQPADHKHYRFDFQLDFEELKWDLPTSHIPLINQHRLRLEDWLAKAIDEELPESPKERAAELLDLTASSEPFLEGLIEASKRPNWQWFVINKTPSNALRGGGAPWVRGITGFGEELAFVINLRATAHLENGNPEQAADEVAALHAFVKSTDGEPTLVGSFVELALADVPVKNLSYLLEQPGWSSESLATVQASLDINLLKNIHQSMRYERVGMVALCEKFAQGDPDATAILKEYSTDHWTGRAALIMPSGWMYQNLDRWKRQWDVMHFDHFDPQAELLKGNGVGDIQSFYDQRSTPYNFLAKVSVPKLSQILPTAAKRQTQWQLHSVACAVQRYRIESGKYPDTLNELIPKYIDRVPHDLATGRPVSYLKESSEIQLRGLDRKGSGAVADFESKVTLATM